MVDYRGIKEDPLKICALTEMQSPCTTKKVQRLVGMIVGLSRFIARETYRCQSFFCALKGGKSFVWDEECEELFLELKKYLASPLLLPKLDPGEPYFLYLLVSEHTNNAVLVKEIEKVKCIGVLC